MNGSRRFFMKISIFLAALLFIGGCNSTETSMSISEYDGFKVERDENNRAINFVHTSDEDVTVILKKEGDERKFTTVDGETILVLANAGYEIKHTSHKLKFSKNSAGDMLFTFSSF
ncbi:MAG: hypothetical protein LBD84_06310 [Campylobacteraceae bacterium]|jgi:hypothetical protein|nr:hypothetical protein [Campylobacteraceae bacterium]